jgi:hypothetical protein
MYIPAKFAAHAALLLSGASPVDSPDQQHLPEEPLGGRLPQPRGPYAYGTDSRPRHNGTGTYVSGTTTRYYGPF